MEVNSAVITVGNLAEHELQLHWMSGEENLGWKIRRHVRLPPGGGEQRARYRAQGRARRKAVSEDSAVRLRGALLQRACDHLELPRDT